jgi:hypothetical protein
MQISKICYWCLAAVSVGTFAMPMSAKAVETAPLNVIGVSTLSLAMQGPPPASVPEPLTIIGTLIGGTVAFHLKNKLSDSSKK